MQLVELNDVVMMMVVIELTRTTGLDLPGLLYSSVWGRLSWTLTSVTKENIKFLDHGLEARPRPSARQVKFLSGYEFPRILFRILAIMGN